VLNSETLKRLAESLPSIIVCSKAESTNVKYNRAWLSWKKWEKENTGVNTFPVSPFIFCLYLRDKLDSCRSPAPIETAIYGVRWAHNMAGVQSPTDNIMVKQFLEASKRLLGKPVRAKKPLELHVITKIGQKFNVPGAPLASLRICYIFFIGFSGLLRCDEIVRITRKNVCIKHDHMSIFCLKRKNDQYSKGHTIYLDRSGKVTCPVSITEKLLDKLPANPDQPLVCRLKSNGSAMHLAISYTRVREIFHETLSEFVEDPKEYGTHSLKKGGASAAHQSGVSDESLDKFAGWKSARSKLSYIGESQKDKLQVSKAINL